MKLRWWRRSHFRTTETFYFIHIRKTAGTSMRQLVDRFFAQDERCPELSEVDLLVKHSKDEIPQYLSQFRFVRGHFRGAAKWFREQPFVFTVLRDPLERTLSEIEQVRRHEADLLHRKLKGRSISELASDADFDRVLNNGQTRVLLAHAGMDYEEMTDDERMKAGCDVVDSLDFVGITELFDTTAQALCSINGWTKPKKSIVANTQITAQRKGLADLSAEDLYTLVQQNTVDMHVYKHARSRFDRECVI